MASIASTLKTSLTIFALVSLSLAVVAEISEVDLSFSGSEKVHSISKRAVAQTSDGSEDVSGLNLALDVDENYPVVFNILLWVGIMLFLATIAICVAIASMDPGRDSLIYRVTSGQRFKKDN